MALGQRIGLTSLAASGDILAAGDWNQATGLLAALRTVTAVLLGGEGIYLGFADSPTDVVISSGSSPLVLAVADDSGYVHWFYLTSDAAITFVATDGEMALYAVIDQQAGVSPAAAVGGAAAVRFIADTVAPPHSLLLGSGEVVDSTFTSWAEAAGARVVGGPLTVRSLADADGDTRVEVEASADDDVVRLITAGVERVVLDATRLELDAGLEVAGDVTLGGTSSHEIACAGRLLLRSVDDAGMAATAGTQRELVYNADDDKVYVCTATGDPANWSALH